MSTTKLGILAAAMSGLVIVLFCVQPKPAFAAPAAASTTIYYSDATHKTEVGEKDITCSSPFIHIYGKTSNYFVTYSDGPC